MAMINVLSIQCASFIVAYVIAVPDGLACAVDAG